MSNAPRILGPRRWTPAGIFDLNHEELCMSQENFLNAQKDKGTFYAATLACLCGIPLSTCLARLRK